MLKSNIDLDTQNSQDMPRFILKTIIFGIYVGILGGVL